MNRPIIAAFAVAATIAGFQPRSSAQRVSVLRIQPTAVEDIRAWASDLASRERAGDLLIRETRNDDLVPGRLHERFDQFFRGVRVSGGDISRQSDRGLTVSLFGVLFDGIDLDVEPTLTPEDARARVAALAGVALGNRPDLVILPLDEDGYALTYRCQAVAMQEASVYFIDAHDGRVRLKQSLLQTQSAVVTGTGVLMDTKKVSVMAQTGTYLADDQLRPPSLRTFDLRGNIARTFDVLNGVTAPGIADRDRSEHDVETGRMSMPTRTKAITTTTSSGSAAALDNQDICIQGITHPVRLGDYATASNSVFGTFYLNAFYCPGCGTDGKGMMVYGVGLPEHRTEGWRNRRWLRILRVRSTWWHMSSPTVLRRSRRGWVEATSPAL